MKLMLKAYAKVNLALDVLRRRADGYHDVKMIMQKIDLYDVLTFSVQDEDIRAYRENDRAAADAEIKLTSDKSIIPLDENNLVYKAVKLMYEEYGIAADMDIHIEKNIPVEAGMAGGSTDCAAAIKAVNEIFGLKLSEKEMMDIGVRLGADVPFCIMSGTALSEGIGEKLTLVKGLSGCFVLVAKPPISVSTGMVYKNLRCDELLRHPDVDGMMDALEKEDLPGVSERMENVLETVTVKLYPKIEGLKDIMKEKGALNAIMSGSGPTVFGLFTDKEKAEEAKQYIINEELSKEVFVVKPV